MVYEQNQSAKMPIDVVHYGYLVKRIALHIAARMPASVQLDDLIQAGMIGLIEAAKKYDGGRGASFETYAGIRIRGAIVDEMRRGDWVPRSVHRNARRILEAMKAVEGRSGRDPTSASVAEEMGVTLQEYQAMANDSVSGRLFSFDETIDDDEVNLSQLTVSEPLQSPAESAQKNALKQDLSSAIDKLPEREKLVLSLYYDEELNLKEIGKVLGVSESRVSQIHAQAALRLRSKLGHWRE